MNKADRYRMTQQIERIRQLQWDKAQREASDARNRADQANAAVDHAQQKAATYTSLARQALNSAHGLSPDLLSGLTHAAGAARNDVQRCRETAAITHTQWQQRMETLRHCQVQRHEAERMVEQAGKAYRRQLEEKQASATEERWLALSYRAANKPFPSMNERLAPTRSEKP